MLEKSANFKTMCSCQSDVWCRYGITYCKDGWRLSIKFFTCSAWEQAKGRFTRVIHADVFLHYTAPYCCRQVFLHRKYTNTGLRISSLALLLKNQVLTKLRTRASKWCKRRCKAIFPFALSHCYVQKFVHILIQTTTKKSKEDITTEAKGTQFSNTHFSFQRRVICSVH